MKGKDLYAGHVCLQVFTIVFSLYGLYYASEYLLLLRV